MTSNLISPLEVLTVSEVVFCLRAFEKHSARICASTRSQSNGILIAPTLWDAPRFEHRRRCMKGIVGFAHVVVILLALRSCLLSLISSCVPEHFLWRVCEGHPLSLRLWRRCCCCCCCCCCRLRLPYTRCSETRNVILVPELITTRTKDHFRLSAGWCRS